jgi:glutaminase
MLTQSRRLTLAIVSLAICAPIAAQAQVTTRTSTGNVAVAAQAAVDAAFAKYRNLAEGKNADYIPALAKVDPKLFGIAIVTPDGKVYTAGDTKTQVSIQSISKVFTMARVIEDSGAAAIQRNMGVDADRPGLQLHCRG